MPTDALCASQMIKAARERRAIFAMNLQEDVDLQPATTSASGGNHKRADYLTALIIVTVGLLYGLTPLMACLT